MAFKMNGWSAFTKAESSPQKITPGKKAILKTGAKLVGKRLLGAALGPVGWAWTAYDVAKGIKKHSDKKKKEASMVHYTLNGKPVKVKPENVAAFEKANAGKFKKS